VKLKDTEQVKGIVKWANETLTPLVPVSSGLPHFRGDSVPSTGRAIIVDLSGMKRIVRVDSRNRVVMVEPGVTFGELQPVLEKARLRLNMPLLPRTSKSVIGSVLEREPVIMPKYHWDIAKRVRMEPVEQIGRVSAGDLMKRLRLPFEEPYWKLRRRGSCYDIFFLTTQDKLPEFIKVMSDVAVQHHYPVADMGIYLQPIVQGISCHCEFSLFFDPMKETEVERVRSLSADAVEALMARGAFFSRPYGPWADMAYRRDVETTAALRKLKGIFDPNDIMNPGKLCL
jgi:FAD/FMN-containing dehydrogenase